MRNVLLVLHVLGAGTWIGGNVVQLTVTPRMSTDGGEPAASWHRTTVRLGTIMYTPAAIVILVTGIWLVIESAVYDFETTFVVVGIVAVVLGAALGMAFFGPQGKKAAMLHDSGADRGETKRTDNRIVAVGLLDTAVIVVAVVAMVYKWGV